MQELKLDENLLAERISLLYKYLNRLKELQGLSEGKFALPNNFDVAAWNLRCALEAVFDIGSHILSRIPGAVFGKYKEIASGLGKEGIVPVDFAEDRLEKMAGYRNRLTHFYFEITPQEMYDIIQNRLDDFDNFLSYIEKAIKREE